MSLAAIGAGSAHAAVGENLDQSCTKYSQDGGTTWGNLDVLSWNTDRPVPGHEVKQASCKIKNSCDTPAKFQVFAGNWELPGGGSATVRANAGSVKGSKHSLAGGPGILVVETGRLIQNTPIDVELFVGIPQGETEQNFTIKPDWSTSLEEVAGDAPVDPVDPTDPGGDGGSGSLDSGSLGSGSLGSMFGSLGGGSSDAAKSVQVSLNAPAIHAGGR